MAAIAAVIIVIVFALGGTVKASFFKTCDVIQKKTPVFNSTCDS